MGESKANPPHPGPPGEKMSIKSQVAESAALTIQNFDPVNQIKEHVCGFHFYSHDMTRQVEAHHYCSHLNQDVRQCIIYDSNEPDAKLIGVEYIISAKLFQTLPEEEKIYWHSHVYEVKSGMLICPVIAPIPGAVEKQAEITLLNGLVDTYGKTWHFWQVDRGDPLPFGPPQLMMSFTEDFQLSQAALDDRDERFNILTSKKREERKDIKSVYNINPTADHWARRNDGMTYQECVFIDSSDPNSPNQVINGTSTPFFRPEFPPKTKLQDLITINDRRNNNSNKHDSDGNSICKAPYRAPNAFIIYRKACVETIRSKGCLFPMTVISSISSQAWKEEPEIVKDEYKRLADEAGAYYKQNYPKASKHKKREKWNIVSFDDNKPNSVESNSTNDMATITTITFESSLSSPGRENVTDVEIYPSPDLSSTDYDFSLNTPNNYDYNYVNSYNNNKQPLSTEVIYPSNYDNEPNNMIKSIYPSPEISSNTKDLNSSPKVLDIMLSNDATFDALGLLL
ncbi:14893_t:CDS:2 [Entrophospora sp. SA101]|nr:14893_t:CDS:2 [Entrophospora sp. SA101]CAJ0880563.1 11870_t:CDS:2 [Entrophospora sp. SA101]